MASVGKKKKAAKRNSSDQTTPKISPSQIPLPEQQPSQSSPPKVESESTKAPSEASSKSWYNRTWPRKAAPVTQIARESISSASNTAAELASAAKASASLKPPKALPVDLTRKSSRSLPADAATTKVHATSDPPPLKQSENETTEDKTKGGSSVSLGKEIGDTADALEGQQKVTPKPKAKSQTESDSQSTSNFVGVANGGSTWLSWFTKSNPQEKASINDSVAKVQEETASRTSKDGSMTQKQPTESELTNGVSDKTLETRNDAASPVSPKRTWLQMFNSSVAERTSEPQKSLKDPQGQTTLSKVEQRQRTPPDSQTKSKEPVVETSPPPDLRGDGKSSGWIFWSRDRRGTSSSVALDSHVGELAISDTPSQKRPKRASISLERPQHTIQEDKAKKQAVKTSESLPSTPKTIKAAESKEAFKETAKTSAKETTDSAQTKAQELEAASKALQKAVPNAILPTFRENFLLQQSPGLMQQLSQLLGYSRSPEPRHLSLIREPPRIKNALAIGVHGYFPAPLIRTVLGQPTGTSIKFADMAVKAIRNWTAARGYDCNVKSAALEGEGRISERVDLLWKLLLNWIDEIRKSDFIFVACHSQGVPVALMLVAKLISFGCVNASRIAVCAMAGVNLGPFADYKSRWISGSAGELFEFSDPKSTVSREYLKAVETCLGFGVRIVYAGSIDDQLVSLESSTFAPISHPHIYRAVFVDGRVHAPNFLVNLIGFALKLRNLGVPDHGLIRELSSPMAGSLYSGDGHSRIYEEEGVYDLAVEFALETTSLPTAPMTQRPVSPNSTSNPYILPFAMRGLLEEEYVKTELYTETQDLLKQFDEWRPTSKVLKDVKFRLEGIRSKL